MRFVTGEFHYRHRLGPGTGRRLASKTAFGTASQCISRVFLALAWTLARPIRIPRCGRHRVTSRKDPGKLNLTISRRTPSPRDAPPSHLPNNYHSPPPQPTATTAKSVASPRRIRTIAADSARIPSTHRCRRRYLTVSSSSPLSSTSTIVAMAQRRSSGKSSPSSSDSDSLLKSELPV